jgi:hypothetical protein
MSVADMLKEYGKWMQSKDLVELVAKRLNVSERQAFRKISQAYKNKEILRQILPDRTVIYGLPEFGFDYEFEVLVDSIEHRIKKLQKEGLIIDAIGIKDAAEELGVPPNNEKLLNAIYKVASKYKIKVEERDSIHRPGGFF